MQKLLHHSVTTIVLAVIAGSFIATSIMMNTTQPEAIGPFGLIIFFSFLYMGITACIYLLWRGLNFTYERKQPRSRTALYSLLIGLGPVTVLALNTLKQLNLLDVVLVVLMIVMLIFYISRR